MRIELADVITPKEADVEPAAGTEAPGSPRFTWLKAFVASARNLLYGPGYNTVDLALSRDFNLSERFKLRFRAEATNAFNHVNLGTPGAAGPANGSTSASFGVITSANSMRKMQFGLRLTF